MEDVMEKMAELEKRVEVLEDGILQLLKGLNKIIIAVVPGLISSNPSGARSLDALNRDLGGISRKLPSPKR
jgi:hypothetical protein